MDDPSINSSRWTGSPAEQVLPGSYRAPTHAIGGSMWSTEWGRTRDHGFEPPMRFTNAQKMWVRLIGVACLSPLLLLAANYFVHAAVSDAFWMDNRWWLLGWSIMMIPILAIEFLAGVPSRPLLRSIVPVATIVANLGFALWYAVTALASHADAVASKPERTFELGRSCGKYCSYTVHQRADGTTIEGEFVGEPVSSGYTCAIAQRLDGRLGFSWIRVIERSPPPPSEIPWPIRREVCFSAKPISEVKG